MSAIAPSFISALTKRPWLARALTPLAAWYMSATGYRQMGLMTDDLINEESETVLKALRRLSPKESYDRVYRIRRATQLSLSHKILPKSEWIKPSEDVPYLTPILEEILTEEKERADLDTITVVKKH